MAIIQNLLRLLGNEQKASGLTTNPLSIYAPAESVGLTLNRQHIRDPLQAYKAHELVYACINKIADVMNDAEIIVEKKTADDGWEKVEGHLLASLFKRPNKYETGRDFRRLMVQSEQSSGIFYGEIIRSGANIPVEIYPLNPERVTPKLNADRSGVAYYEFRNSSGQPRQIKPENMLIRRRVDLVNRFFGMSPVAVALKTINSDTGLTDYVDAFFDAGGSPAGILKFLGGVLNDTKKEETSAKWRLKYARGGSNQRGIAVLDDNWSYQAIGSNLDELDSDKLGNRFESRICSVFGVPPILVGALVGLTHTTANATAKAALRDFWDNKVSPELAVLREWLTWFLLPEFESIELIQAEKIRVGFDISQAAFLQDDVDKIHERAQNNVRSGFWTVNEGRQLTGMAADPEGDYYLQPANTSPQSPEVRADAALLPVKQVAQGKAPKDAENDGEGTDANEKGGIIPPQLPPPSSQKKTEKSVEYDGLTLAREPRGVELLINLKTLVSDFESEKEKASNILLKFRKELIEQAATAADALTPETIYQLTLAPNQKTRKQIEKTFQGAYKRGRAQIREELNAQKGVKSFAPLEFKDLINDGEEISELTDLSIAKIISEITARAVNAFVSLKTLGNYTLEALLEVLLGESTKFVETQAGNAINAAIRAGRVAEILKTDDEWHTLEYSAILDVNTCDTCKKADGKTADNLDDLPDAPTQIARAALNADVLLWLWRIKIMLKKLLKRLLLSLLEDDYEIKIKITEIANPDLAYEIKHSTAPKPLKPPEWWRHSI